jgi:hypothetical protein
MLTCRAHCLIVLLLAVGAPGCSSRESKLAEKLTLLREAVISTTVTTMTDILQLLLLLAALLLLVLLLQLQLVVMLKVIGSSVFKRPVCFDNVVLCARSCSMTALVSYRLNSSGTAMLCKQGASLHSDWPDHSVHVSFAVEFMICS